MTRVLATALLASTLAACGLRTMPRPPEDTAPVIPGRVEVTREEGGARLRWQRPERSADGRRLEDLAAFVVERKAGDETGWTEAATIDVVDQEKIRRRRDFSWRDTAPGPASYRVTAVCADGERGAPVEAVEAAAAVESVEAPAP